MVILSIRSKGLKKIVCTVFLTPLEQMNKISIFTKNSIYLVQPQLLFVICKYICLTAFFSDLRRLNSMAMKAVNTGMIIIGGGLIKHHICNANLMVSVYESKNKFS